MEQYELTDENLQDVTGGIDKTEKISLSVGAGVVGTMLTVGGAVAIMGNRGPKIVRQDNGAMEHSYSIHNTQSTASAGSSPRPEPKTGSPNVTYGSYSPLGMPLKSHSF